MKNLPKEEQKQHLIDMMKGDEELGLYEETKKENTMKTPQEKAKKLISTNSLTILSVVGNKLTMDEVKEIAKEFTLSEIDEILKVSSFYNDSQAEIIYFKEVKEELCKQ